MAKTYTREERRNAGKRSTRENASVRRELERLEAQAARLAVLVPAGAVTAPRGRASV